MDGLRGVAVAGVVAYHLGYLQGGFLGVDLFFVLSGFLITSLVLAEWSSTGTIGLGQFWLRRGRRLLPALFGVLAAVAAYAAFVAEPAEFARIRRDGLATLLYVQNWNEIRAGTDYWDQFQAPSPLQHMWSLAIEEQFYVLWPLILFAVLGRKTSPESGNQLSRNRIGRLFGFCVVAAIASASAMIIQHHPNGDVARVYYGTDTRAAAILIGAALACAFALWGHPRTTQAKYALQVAALVAATALAYAWTTTKGQDNALYEGGFALCGIAVAVIIAAVTTTRTGPLARALSWTPLRLLGAISYGLYLWHWPVIVLLTPDRAHTAGATLALLRAAVALALSIISYRLIEQPIRRNRISTRPLLIATPAAFAACAALLVATTIVPAQAAKELAAAQQAQTFRTDHDVPPLAPGEKRILLLGDSGAHQLGDGLHTIAKQNNASVVNEGVTGCAMADGALPQRDTAHKMVDQPECGEWLKFWQQFVDAYEPHAVLFFQASPGGNEVRIDGKWHNDCSPRFRQFFVDKFVESLQVLTSGGAAVFVATIPYREVYGAADVRDMTDCRNDMAAEAVQQVPGTHLIDLAGWTCPAGECLREREGVKLRHDGLHFNGDGAEVAGRWLIPQILDELPSD